MIHNEINGVWEFGSQTTRDNVLKLAEALAEDARGW